jgi:hypothetical protein
MSTIKAIALVLAFSLGACASPSGQEMSAGVTTEAHVRKKLGEPAMQWTLPGGGRQLAFPRGPAGYETFMVYLDAEGRFERQENVLAAEHFAKIRADMTRDDVLRLIGPPQAHWEIYFPARDELVWEWRYCNAWSEPARFNVMFDATSGRVRSTLAQSESQRGFRPEKC